jgi:regulator of nonsense transcripts 2
MENEAEEEEELEEDEEEDSQSRNPSENDEEEEVQEADEAANSSSSDSSSDQEESIDKDISSYRRGNQSAEAEEFQREFDKMIADAMESRKYENRNTNNQLANAESMIIQARNYNKTASNNSYVVSAPPTLAPLLPSDTAASSVSSSSSASFVPFQLLLKRKTAGHSYQVRPVDLLVPADSRIAIENESKRREEKEEQEKLKQFVMKSIQREEREGMAEEIGVPARGKSANPGGKWGKPLNLNQLYAKDQ